MVEKICCDLLCGWVVVAEKASDASFDVMRATSSLLSAYLVSPATSWLQPSFQFVVAVYGATYISVNMIHSCCGARGYNPFWPTLLGAAAANMGLGVAKDRYFAMSFGGAHIASSFPLFCWAIFWLRDVMTMAAGFNLPRVISEVLWSKKWILSRDFADKIAQLLVPLTAQIIVTPLHLLALDLYYRPGEEGMLGRLQHIREILRVALGVRLVRVLAAYGIAGVLNNSLRDKLRKWYLDLIEPIVLTAEINLEN